MFPLHHLIVETCAAVSIQVRFCARQNDFNTPAILLPCRGTEGVINTLPWRADISEWKEICHLSRHYTVSSKHFLMNAYLTVINSQLAIIHVQGPWAQVLISWWDTKHSGLSIIRAALANQNITNNIWHTSKPKEWPSCLAHKLKNTWRLRAGGIRTTTFQKPFHRSQFLDTWCLAFCAFDVMNKVMCGRNVHYVIC